MCRIAVATGNIAGKPDFIAGLRALELEGGGDGNGVWFSEHNAIIKGVNLPVDFVSGYLNNIGEEELGNGVVVFHTRISSAGKDINEHNHPFRVGESAVLVHNGTWSEAGKYALDEVSDTQVIAELYRKYGKGVFAAQSLDRSGVFVVVERLPDKIVTEIFHTMSGERLGVAIKDGGFVAMSGTKQPARYGATDVSQIVSGRYSYLHIETARGHSKLSVIEMDDEEFQAAIIVDTHLQQLVGEANAGATTKTKEMIGQFVLAANAIQPTMEAFEGNTGKYESWMEELRNLSPDACALCPYNSSTICNENMCPVYAEAAGQLPY